MKNLVCSALALTLLAGAAGCRQAPDAEEAQPAEAAAATPQPEPPKPMPAELPPVLARVNDEEVTKSDLDRLIRNIEMSAGQPVPAERRDEILRGALDQLITYTALRQEIRARNIAIPEPEVEANLAQMRKQFPTEKDFEKALADRSMTMDRLRADARIDMAINKMMEDEVALEPEANDAQVRDFFDKNPDKFKQDEAVRASHILIGLKPDADDATKQKARARAEDLARQAKGGADFADLARKNSDDGSAQAGGDLNYFVPGQMVAPFDRAAFSMQPGQVSDVVDTEFGFHVIKVTDRRAASTVSFEQVSSKIRDHLTQQARQARAQTFIEAVKNKAKIEVLV